VCEGGGWTGEGGDAGGWRGGAGGRRGDGKVGKRRRERWTLPEAGHGGKKEGGKSAQSPLHSCITLPSPPPPASLSVPYSSLALLCSATLPSWSPPSPPFLPPHTPTHTPNTPKPNPTRSPPPRSLGRMAACSSWPMRAWTATPPWTTGSAPSAPSMRPTAVSGWGS
jgi:hypothetical protein